jgi:hypothetical protein
MQLTVGKILSLLIALAYATAAIHWGGAAYWKWSAGLLLPLSFIWFPEEIGNLTGFFDTGYVNVKTPGVFISLIGWFFLVGVPVLLYVLVVVRHH